MKKGKRNLLQVTLATLLGIAAFTATERIALGQGAQPQSAGEGIQQQVAPQEKVAARTTATDRYAFDLSGTPQGWVTSADGGGASSDVVTEKIGPDLLNHKRIVLKYDPITIVSGVMAKPFYDWIADVITGPGYQVKDGSIHLTDSNGSIKRTMDFSRAAIEEITFPGVDRTSKDEGHLQVKFQIANSRSRIGRGKIQPTVEEQKRWFASNFRLTIDGVETGGVTNIQPIFLERKANENPAGPDVSIFKVHDLVITLPEAQARDFLKWQQTSGRKIGTLEYLAPDSKTVLFQLEFKGLALKTLAPVRSSTARNMQATMSVDSLAFSVNPN